MSDVTRAALVRVEARSGACLSTPNPHQVKGVRLTPEVLEVTRTFKKEYPAKVPQNPNPNPNPSLTLTLTLALTLTLTRNRT